METSAGTLSDTVITIYGPDGSKIGEDDDDGVGRASRFEFEPRSSGTRYYVKVEGYRSNTGAYGLSVEAEPQMCDNFSSSEECLVHRFAPVLKMHPDERFFPRPVEGFVEQATLKDGSGRTVTTGPSLDSLRDQTYDELHYLDVPDHIEDSTRYPITVYWRVTVSRTVIDRDLFVQYYLFYNYDHLNPLQERTACARLANPEQHDLGVISDDQARDFHGWFCPPHEADWELIQLEFNDPNVDKIIEQGHMPEDVEYSQHGWSGGRDWSDLEEHDNGHPVAYVALGKHANYFAHEDDSEYVSNVRGPDFWQRKDTIPAGAVL